MSEETADLIRPERFFQERFGMDGGALERGLAQVLGRRVDYADLFFEYRINESLGLEEGIVKSASRQLTQGVGVRAVAAERTGYAYSDEITVPDLELAADRARYIAAQAASAPPVPVPAAARPRHDLYPVRVTPAEVPAREKVDLLHRIDAEARRYDPRITKAMISVASEHRIILVATSEGTLVGDVRPLTRLHVTCIAEAGGRREAGAFGGGGRVEFGYFLEEERFARYAREAARQAIANLDAVECPAGTMTVILGPGWPGILLHEAVGHGLEADFNRKALSAFSGRIGQRVASPLCSVVDDGTIPARRGSLNVDDEGVPTRRTVLIENGVLVRYMQDRLNARLMDMPLTGNGRRQSYAHIVMPRMTNTFMLAGDSEPEEIIRSVDRGLYAVAFGGGQVDITNGKFVFSASEAYLVEGGRIGRPVKGATLIGNGPDALTRVTMVGNDLRLDEGVGTCGKDGQWVPVGVGLPTVRLAGVTVGGTRA